jgi:hypothetical protein
MIEDFRDASAPIVNTDYRFSGMLKFRRGFSHDRSLAARIQFGHESTHLGDEFSIHALRAYPLTFERINVSWQYLDAGALYEWDLGQQAWSARGGVTASLPLHSSYYQTDPGSLTQSRIGPVTESKNWYDPYAGLELKREGLLFDGGYDLYASSELRWRSIYDYHKTNANQSEQRQASINLITGIKKTGTVKGFGRASPFFRYYRGVNPHGQFRNQKSFTEMGIGVRVFANQERPATTSFRTPSSRTARSKQCSGDFRSSPLKSMNYDRDIVISTFRALHPDDLDVTEADFEQLDESLQIEFDAEVRKQADANGISKSKFNLSRLVSYAALSTATTVATQVKQACKFFVEAQP